MVKQKRNAGSGAEFTGFSAFASHQSSAATAVQLSRTTANATKAPKNEHRLKANPVYTGTDSHLMQIFKRISKKDSTTKSRAISELSSYAFSCDESGCAQQTKLLKSDQISVLSHVFFLLSNKLVHDNNPLVRKESLKLLACALAHVPKACSGLLRQDASALDVSGKSIGSIGNIIGWTYSFQSSQIKDESKVAKNVWQSMIAVLRKFDDNDVNAHSFVKRCIIAHVESILQSSSRATNLAAGLSIRGKNVQMTQPKMNKKKGKGKNSEANESTSESLSESEKDEIEERYERVVLLTLHSVVSYIRDNPEVENDKLRYGDIVTSNSVLWKHLSSPKGSFRRATFSLVSCISQNATSLIHYDISEPGTKKSNISSLILNILSSERDLANFGSLFEMILLFIASFRKFKIGAGMAWATKDSEEICCRGMDLNVFTKSMSKALKKACYGSSSAEWGPMILPILATIQASDQQLQIVKSLWSGKAASVSSTDAMAIVSSVTECTIYLLVQEDAKSTMATENYDQEQNHAFAKEYAQIFLDCLSYYLTGARRGSSPTTAENELCSTLIRDIFKLHNLPSDRKPCKFSCVTAWFWGEGMKSVLKDLNAMSVMRLRPLVDGIAKMAKNMESKNKELVGDASFNYSLKAFFWDIVYSRCGGSFPNRHELSILVSILKFCTIAYTFDTINETHGQSSESFCEDTLVNWISLLCSVPDNKISLEMNFELLFMLMAYVEGISGGALPVWEHCIQKVKNQSDSMEIMMIGLKVLANRYESLIDTLRCQTFDEFATTIAIFSQRTYQDNAGSSDFDESRTDLELSFLCLSAGVQGLAVNSLVRSETIENWIDIVLSNETDYGIHKERHVLLETILLVAYNNASVVDRGILLQVIIQAWKEGGPTWTCTALTAILSSDKSLRGDLLSSFSTIMQAGLKVEGKSGANLDLDSYLWADRASRAIILYYEYSDGNFFPLKFVGFDDVGLWSSAMKDVDAKRCEYLYLCFIYLLQQHSDGSIQDLFKEAEADVPLGLHILMGFVTFGRNKPMTKRCQNLMVALGREIRREIIESYVHKLIDTLAIELESKTLSRIYAKRALVVLDWLVALLIPKFIPPESLVTAADNVDQNEVKEGDTLWYIVDGNKINSERLQATITKVHRDDFPNLYFSINIDGSAEGSRTKQTVSSRLKKLQNRPYIKQNLPDQSVQRLEDAMIAKLVKPFIGGSNGFTRDIAAETLNSTVSFCGLQGKSGIGSTRFDAFQIFSKMEQELCTILSGENFSFTAVGPNMKRLANALGYGELTTRSEHNCEILKFDGKSLMNVLEKALHDDIESVITAAQNRPETALFSCNALLMFIRMTAKSIMSVENASFLWEIMETVTSQVARSPEKNDSIFLVLEGIEELKRSMAPILGETMATSFDSIQACVTNLFELFVNMDDLPSKSHTLGEYFIDDTLVKEKGTDVICVKPFESYIIEELQNDSVIVTNSAMIYTEHLLQSLCSPLKQWVSFQLLQASAKKRNKFYEKYDDVELNDKTSDNLDFWLEGLDEEEAIEIEEDVIISAQWIPRHLMSRLETWKFHPLIIGKKHNIDEQACTTRILQWLLCLEYLDSASSIDMRNRAHITSYVEKTGAIKEVFEIAMFFSELEEQQQADLFSCISIDAEEHSFHISQICTLAIFRSIELMPTLCKSWFNDECPRSLQTQVNTFVESMVAPETLKREMHRIRNTSDLGDLEVNGSCVSREIIATYMQDECKLSVLIRVPPSFPLRNAEVDCQKTLGISDKRWRYWSLQIMRMLNSQDGSILDALLLWKQNVDKEFEGVEPCPVCYSVLCVKTHAMPNLECKTCNNRFHSSCLYKWFSSSGKNQCVLCQQPWNGTKVA